MISGDDAQAIDADVRAAMLGTISFSELLAKWGPRCEPGERHALIRYVSERVHDVLVSWTAALPPG